MANVMNGIKNIRIYEYVRKQYVRERTAFIFCLNIRSADNK